MRLAGRVKILLAAEDVRLGDVIDGPAEGPDWRHVMQVGHVVIGRKWVTYRAFHPEVNVYANGPQRVARGALVVVWVEPWRRELQALRSASEGLIEAWRADRLGGGDDEACALDLAVSRIVAIADRVYDDRRGAT